MVPVLPLPVASDVVEPVPSSKPYAATTPGWPGTGALCALVVNRSEWPKRSASAATAAIARGSQGYVWSCLVMNPVARFEEALCGSHGQRHDPKTGLACP